MGLGSGLVVRSVLLLTVGGTQIAMHLVGIAMQRISPGALIIALGTLASNAIGLSPTDMGACVGSLFCGTFLKPKPAPDAAAFRDPILRAVLHHPIHWYLIGA
jgi:hypothetical protein